MKKITLRQAVVAFLQHRCDNLLKLLISGAATKPSVKKILQKYVNSPLESRNNPIRKKAFHGNYRSMFLVNKKKSISDEEFVLK